MIKDKNRKEIKQRTRLAVKNRQIVRLEGKAWPNPSSCWARKTQSDRKATAVKTNLHLKLQR